MQPWELQFSFMGSLPHSWPIIYGMQGWGTFCYPGPFHFLTTLEQLSIYFLPGSWSISVLLKHFIKKSSDKSLQSARGLFHSSYHGFLLTHLLQEVRDGSWKPQSCTSLQTVCAKGIVEVCRPALCKIYCKVLHYNCTYKVETSKTSVQYMKEKIFQLVIYNPCEFAAQSVEKKITQWDCTIPVGMLTTFFPS